MLCSHYGCKDAAEDGKKQCRPHLDSSSKYQTGRRTSLLKDGKCIRCANESRPNKTMCQVCADKWNAYLKNRRSSK